MNSAESVFSTILPKDTFINLINGMNESQLQFLRIIWLSFIAAIKVNRISITIILLAVLVVSVVMAKMGQWWLLGKVLYNYLYFFILLIAGLIWGSDIFLSDFFHEVCTIILYPICYKVVGKILKRFNIK